MELEKRAGLDGLASATSRALEASADPAGAAALAHAILAALDETSPDELRATLRNHREGVLRVLAALGGAAPFLAAMLTRHPEWLPRLAAERFAEPRSPQALREALDRALDGSRLEDAPARLRRVKYYELARITVRELGIDLVPESREREVLAELSHLADALLAKAVDIARARLEVKRGPAEWIVPGASSPVRPGFCVLGLGKLGSQELNYSSDVDLIYAWESLPGEPEDGPGGASPIEYFSELAVELGRIVTPVTADGFLYRIDLDLRPEGSQSPIVVSTSALVEYYDTRAATWEKAAFMKARPVAGDLEAGWRVVRAIAPMIYRRSMDFASVAAIRDLKERIEREKGRADGLFNVKIGAGGIRDVEFVAQAMQLLHGGRIPQVRGRSTAGALEALRDVGLLSEGRASELLSAYVFLRRVENRIQMVDERQVYELPRDDAARLRLARSMLSPEELESEDDPLARVESRLAEHRARVRRVFTETLPDAPQQRIADLFARFTAGPGRSLHAAHLIERLAEDFARAIEAGPDSERAMSNLARFVEGLGSRAFYHELLLDRPELIPRLAALFASSDYLSGILASHPRLIEPIFDDPEVLLLDRPALERAFATIHTKLASEGRTEPELGLAALRLFHRREVVNVGLLDLDERVSAAESSASLSDVAEVALARALDFAARVLQRTSPSVGEFLVVGMGKLATREITYGSDLDLIFLYAVPDGDDAEAMAAQEYYVRLAQKLIWALQTRTPEGLCYEIDTRLRPSGNQGVLVTSFRSFARYHEQHAALWERQALLRARPVAGAEALGRAFEENRLEILLRPLPDDATDETHRIRQRMENEVAREDRHRRDFKTGRGGLTDIEMAVQLFQLRHGREHAALLATDRTDVQLERLESLGLLEHADVSAFREGWAFLTRLSSRLRILDNRSISDLDEERGDLDGLARRLGYESQQREGARRILLADYRRVTDEVRAAYLRVLGVPART